MNPIQLHNITVPLEDNCLSVNIDLEILFTEDETVHPDNPIKPKTENRAVKRINWVEFLLLNKIGIALTKEQWSPVYSTISQLVINELGNFSIDEIKTM